MPADALIINADDLGLCAAVDAGILEAWHDGAVSDSTVFATAPALAETLARARAAGLPVGVHLNLTQGCPLSDPADIPALVTPAGTFMKRQHWQLPLPAEQVRRELTAQVERVLALGGSPSHLDSHHHVHRYPEVLAATIALARQLGVPVRHTDDAQRVALRAAGIATPDCFTMAFYGERATTATLIAAVEACPGGVLEIMTHPARAGEVPGSYTSERVAELRVLTAASWREYLAARHLPLVPYAAVQPHGA